MKTKRTENPEAAERRATRKTQAVAFDSMCANRPLKPPPMRLAPAAVSAGALALAQDKRSGAYNEVTQPAQFGSYKSDDERDDNNRPMVVRR